MIVVIVQVISCGRSRCSYIDFFLLSAYDSFRSSHFIYFTRNSHVKVYSLWSKSRHDSDLKRSTALFDELMLSPVVQLFHSDLASSIE